jgi:hypothetical protein
MNSPSNSYALRRLGLCAVLASIAVRTLFIVLTRGANFGAIQIPLYCLPLCGTGGLFLALAGWRRTGAMLMGLTGLCEALFGALQMLSFWLLPVGAFFVMAGGLWVGAALSTRDRVVTHA